MVTVSPTFELMFRLTAKAFHAIGLVQKLTGTSNWLKARAPQHFRDVWFAFCKTHVPQNMYFLNGNTHMVYDIAVTELVERRDVNAAVSIEKAGILREMGYDMATTIICSKKHTFLRQRVE